MSGVSDPSQYLHVEHTLSSSTGGVYGGTSMLLGGTAHDGDNETALLSTNANANTVDGKINKPADQEMVERDLESD